MQSQRPRNRNSAKSNLPVFLAFVCVLAASAGAQETLQVEGQVLSNQGIPIPTAADVKLETLEGSLVGSRPTDSRGLFSFINVPRGYYRLTASAEGYQTSQQPVDVRRGAGARFMITIMLTPIGQSQSRPANNGDTVSVTDLSAPKRARKAFEKGERELSAEKVKEARASFEQAVAEHPCYARAHTRLGVTLEMEGDFAGAESALKKALECDGGYLEAHAQLGILLNHLKRFEESKASLEGAVGRFPASWQLHYQLAAAEYGLGRFREAEQEYLKALSAGKDVNPEIHVRLADVYTRLREHDKAYAELQEYLRASPSGRFAAKVTDVIQRMETEGVVHPLKTPSAPAQP